MKVVLCDKDTLQIKSIRTIKSEMKETFHEKYGSTYRLFFDSDVDPSVQCGDFMEIPNGRVKFLNTTQISKTPLGEIELVQAGAEPIILKQPLYTDGIALLRLDGLGGTLTLSDQAKKLSHLGYPITLIIRGYEELFSNNPYVNNIINVGITDWSDCLEKMKGRFAALADIRFGPGKWYQEKPLFKQDFSEWEDYYRRFPRTYNKLVNDIDMHHIQLTDLTLGLPYDSIETEIFNIEYKDFKIGEDYICVNNGVDALYKGHEQTKSWNYWNQLVNLLKKPVVQVGTRHDTSIAYTTDLRGRTSIPQLCGVLKKAKAIVCHEGGIMHLAYALNHPKTIVIRGPTRVKAFQYPGQILVDSYLCKPCVFKTDDWFLNCHENADKVCIKSITPERVYEALVEN
ncbi:hypothetical protein LCGC14_0511940 [marine sediment metagenome]|uniref:Glycosyltransferase family 9 (Heptosyltransferase) n=1 Tax=marine sediment metagenome TaxID=412755 RepID=A0A0F9V9A2_9ZZZZ